MEPINLNNRFGVNKYTKEESDLFIKQIRSLPGADTFGTKSEIRILQTILLPGETVYAVTSGLMDGHTWLMAATNKRVLLMNRNMGIGLQQMEIPLDKINSISLTTGFMLSDIIIYHGSSSMKIERVLRGSEKYFVDATNQAIRNYSVGVHINDLPTQEAACGQILIEPVSVADEITKLKQLLDCGALTQEEFDAEKKKLLS